MLLSFADGNGPVVTALTEIPGSKQLIITFDGPLNPGPAEDLANYQIARSPANPELITSNGPAVKIVSANYSDTGASQVTLTLKTSLKPSVFYRVFINGAPAGMSANPTSNPLTDINGVLLDGDNDDTPGGNFYGLFALGSKVAFTDSNSSHVTLAAKGGGTINVWRELDGDIDQLSVVGIDASSSTLTGSVRGGASLTVYFGSVTFPVAAPLTLNGASEALPQSFVTLTAALSPPAPPPTATSPTPVVATSSNLPYTLAVIPVNTAATFALAGIQAADYATAPPTKAYPDGLWLIFGGRTNGLHNFTASTVTNFPPDFQNEDIYVINPANWQTWSIPWSSTDVPVSTYNSLSSAAQDFYQKANTLYTVGGYSVPDTINFTASTVAGNTTVQLSSAAGLAVGQYLTGAAIPLVNNPILQVPVIVTITAVGTNTITLSQPAIATTTGGALTASTANFTTYDTLTTMNIKGMIRAVMSGGNVARGSAIRQISDPRLQVTGGDLGALGARTYLVFGQDFQGGYSIPINPAATPTFTQIYSAEVRSFRIVATRKSLAIRGYQTLRDSTNFRRRDGNMGTVITRSGQLGLTYYGGVFSPGNNFTSYQAPVIIGSNDKVRVNASYQQYFDQYTTANIPLYNAKSRAMISIFLGGISTYDYSTGQLVETPPGGAGPPWVDDVSSLLQDKNGTGKEYIMAPIPGTSEYYGAYSSFFASPFVPAYSNGVIKLNKLKRPTVLGYIYGGIVSTAPQTANTEAQTGASNQVFQVTLTPSR